MQISVVGEQISQEEINAYIDYGTKKYSGRIISGMTVKTDGEFVDLTGYLVGTLDRFNNGKRAEESDRVKHVV